MDKAEASGLAWLATREIRDVADIKAVVPLDVLRGLDALRFVEAGAKYSQWAEMRNHKITIPSGTPEYSYRLWASPVAHPESVGTWATIWEDADREWRNGHGIRLTDSGLAELSRIARAEPLGVARFAQLIRELRQLPTLDVPHFERATIGDRLLESAIDCGAYSVADTETGTLIKSQLRKLKAGTSGAEGLAWQEAAHGATQRIRLPASFLTGAKEGIEIESVAVELEGHLKRLLTFEARPPRRAVVDPFPPLSLSAAASCFSLDPRTLEDWIGEGIVAARQMGSRWLFCRKDVQERHSFAMAALVEATTPKPKPEPPSIELAATNVTTRGRPKAAKKKSPG